MLHTHLALAGMRFLLVLLLLLLLGHLVESISYLHVRLVIYSICPQEGVVRDNIGLHAIRNHF